MKFSLGPAFDGLRGFIHSTAVVGEPPEMRDYRFGTEHKGVEVRPAARIGAFCSVDGGFDNPTRIGRCWLMKHVHIGHDAVIGDGVEVAPHTSVGGYVRLEANVKVGQGATFKPCVVVGEGARIGMGAVVTKDVPAGETWVGNPAAPINRESDDALWSHLYEAS